MGCFPFGFVDLHTQEFPQLEKLFPLLREQALRRIVPAMTPVPWYVPKSSGLGGKFGFKFGRQLKDEAHV
jgi:hypothetical protein